MRILGSIALVIAGLYFAHSVVSGGLPLSYAAEISALHALDPDAYSLLLLMLPAIYIPLQLIVGFLLDRYGARRIMMSVAALAALGLVLSVAVEIPAIGATGRALHALGAAFAFVGALYIAARSFDKSRFATCAGLVQAFGFAAIGLWYVSGEASASLLDLPRRYYFAAGGAVLLALLFALFSYVKPVQDGEDRPGFMRQLLGEIGSVLIRPRLWLIVIAMAFAAVPVGVYAPIWVASEAVPAQSLAGLAPREIAALFVISFALGSLIAGWIGDGIGRRRGILFLFQLLAAAAFALLAFSPSINPLHVGALLVAGGFFTGANVLFYALGNDRAPPHHAGLFLALIHAAFMLGAAGSAYAAAFVQPWTDVVDLTQYFAPICLAVAAGLSLITPDKGPMAIAGPVADWEKTAAKAAPAAATVAAGKDQDEQSLDEPEIDLEDAVAKGEPDGEVKSSDTLEDLDRDSDEKSVATLVERPDGEPTPYDESDKDGAAQAGKTGVDDATLKRLEPDQDAAEDVSAAKAEPGNVGDVSASSSEASQLKQDDPDRVDGAAPPDQMQSEARTAKSSADESAAGAQSEEDAGPVKSDPVKSEREPEKT